MQDMPAYHIQQEVYLAESSNQYVFNQPPFGKKIAFSPKPGSLKKPTYQQMGLQPRVIYAQDDLRGNGQITDGFTVEKSDTVVFLVGPSFHDTPVSQWRLDVIEKLAPYLPTDTVLVVPQHKNFLYEELPNAKDTQVEWEHQWLQRADIIAINLSLHWKNPNGSEGNIGPTTRFETGYYFAKADEKDLVLFAPSTPKPDGLGWVNFHAKELGLPMYREYSDFYQAILDACHDLHQI